MINGKDPISLQVISAFESKRTLADIAAQFGLTLDQVKRIKRFYNYSQKVQTMLGPELAKIYEALGTKGLVLAKYFKANDINAIQEILSISTVNVTRDELIELSAQYDEKMKRIQGFENGCIHDEANTIHRDLKAVISSHIQSFEEPGNADDFFSEREIERFRLLQSLAMKWLYRKGYVVASEVELPNNSTADVAGVKDGHVVIVDVKINSNDYKCDEKWPEYLPYCDEFYFLFDFFIETPPPTGILRVNEHDAITEWYKSKLSHQCRAVEQVSTSINRILSRKFVFGY
ncbi:MAG: MmcB family DNA repair protein [Kurthia sp.]|nr:MmcB family DNA repair protein [Candidatus Kurthia equi]